MKLVLLIFAGWSGLSLLAAAAWCVLRRYEKALLRRRLAAHERREHLDHKPQQPLPQRRAGDRPLPTRRA